MSLYFGLSSNTEPKTVTERLTERRQKDEIAPAHFSNLQSRSLLLLVRLLFMAVALALPLHLVDCRYIFEDAATVGEMATTTR